MTQVTTEEILSIAQRLCGGFQQKQLYLLGRADVLRYQQYDPVVADARVSRDSVDGGLNGRRCGACGPCGACAHELASALNLLIASANMITFLLVESS